MTYFGRLCPKGFLFQDRPFHGQVKVNPSTIGKKCLEFESDLLKSDEDIAHQSREILQTCSHTSFSRDNKFA